MNEKFFSLPEEKRRAILNAGYRVFSQNSFRNSPMSEIAAQAGISKSLLFHYFRNKKELYLFLWESCAKITIEYLTRCGCYSGDTLFEHMERGFRAKMEIIRRHFNLKSDRARVDLYPEQFVEGLDIEMMYREMVWAAEGYLWELPQRGQVDVDQMERGFRRLIDFWKRSYLRRG